MNAIDKYKEILKVLETHDDILANDYEIDSITCKIKNRIKIQEIIKEFRIYLKPETNPKWCKAGSFGNIGMFGPEFNRTISWSDDGSQPDNERLYVIAFPTGAYIWGDSYPTGTFNKFFLELKSFGAKYVDTKNNCLYFGSDNASKAHDRFYDIYKKYSDMVGEENRLKKIESLQKELEAQISAGAAK